ncbi:unnamed protein product [Arabidopsis arenosa]|uniref:Uncharacterized protein n=1 Tax=Arabidopsis arenosa TaxID=38785 RepID=A0A8S1ZLX8_ARAAE|nr:unnamed protein product [Arabidopsis arenosa]
MENLPRNLTSSDSEQPPPPPTQVEGGGDRSTSRSSSQIELPLHNQIDITEQIARRSADELAELRKMILTLVERSQTQKILNRSLVARMEYQEQELTNVLPEAGRLLPQATPNPASTSIRPSGTTPPSESTPRTHLDFTRIEVTPRVNRQVAFTPSSLGNPSAETETRITPTFPRFRSPPLLPRGYSPPRYTWIRNQTPASSSHALGNLPQLQTPIVDPPSGPTQLRTSTRNLRNGSVNPQIPFNNARHSIPPLYSSNYTQTIDPKSIVVMETFRNYAAQTNANMAQMHSKAEEETAYLALKFRESKRQNTLFNAKETDMQ